MGSFEVDLAELRNQAVSKKWYALEGGEGEIELILQWYHDPALAYDPFEEVEEDVSGRKLLTSSVSPCHKVETSSSRTPTSSSSGGTSDPRAILNVVGGSSVKLSHTTDTH